MDTSINLAQTLELALYPHKVNFSYRADDLTAKENIDHFKITSQLNAFIQQNTQELIESAHKNTKLAATDFCENFGGSGMNEKFYPLPEGGNGVLSVIAFGCCP